MESESPAVVKVKYGDTLRRFIIPKELAENFNVAWLRAKICSIFNFPAEADANLVLTYVDEDGDVVTLVDDNDLQDVMMQDLKFLRIDVQITDNGGKSNAGSSGSATPLRSPPVSNPFVDGNFVKADVFDALPEPLREVLVSSISKAASSSPVLATIADSITKIGQSILNSYPQPHVAADTGSANCVPEATITSEAKGPQAPHVASASNASVHARSSGSTTPLMSPGADLLRERLSKLARNHPVAATASSQVHANLANLFSKLGQPRPLNLASNASQQVKAGGAVAGGVPHSTNVNGAPLSATVPVGDRNKGKVSTDDSFAGIGESCGTSTSSVSPKNSATQTTATCFGAPNYCPFSGIYNFHPGASPSSSLPLTNNIANIANCPSLFSGISTPFKRSHSHNESMRGMFHKGIRCDGCGVFPITGPRFNSKLNKNFDLCSICFNKMGNEADYIRMDRPASALALHGPQPHIRPPQKLPTLPSHYNKKHARSKLDSQFILDVNILDGTKMAPSTAFTKIWRMRNNGTSVWPKGTELVRIGGDVFCDCTVVEIEALDNGVPVGNELDIAVDFRAPQLPGRYISHWRMSSPTGQEFGQCVWVLIQVDASLKDDSFQILNTNIPLDVSGSKGPQVIDINVQPMDEDTSPQPFNPSAPTEPVNQMVDKEPMQEPYNPNAPTEPVNQMVDKEPRQETYNPSAPTEPVNQMVDKESRQEAGNEIAVNETAFVGPAAAPPTTSAAPSYVPYPLIDINMAGMTLPVPSKQQTSAVDSVVETLLKELEEMGFNEVDLNKYVLRMNEYNLEQTVADLCGQSGVSGWDPILEELQEMGFRDDEKNKRLLRKNNGSIKRVVMDLINGE